MSIQITKPGFIKRYVTCPCCEAELEYISTGVDKVIERIPGGYSTRIYYQITCPSCGDTVKLNITDRSYLGKEEKYMLLIDGSNPVRSKPVITISSEPIPPDKERINAIKILKPGRKKTEAKCDECGCEFSFTLDEVIRGQVHGNDSLVWREELFVRCPHCEKRIEVNEKRYTEEDRKYMKTEAI